MLDLKEDYLFYAGIPPHIDTHSAFEDGIISLSLGSQVKHVIPAWLKHFTEGHSLQIPCFILHKFNFFT